MSYTPATLTGHFEKQDQTPAQGRVEIIPNSKVIVDGASNVVMAGRLKVTLDAQGEFSVQLPPTDDATLEPAVGRQYAVLVSLNHSNDVPKLTGITLAAGTTHDWADLVSGVEASAVYSAFFTESDFDDLIAADAANASAITAEASLRVQGDAALDVRVDALEAAPGGVTSVNTRTGAIALAKGDVGLGSVDNTPDTSKPVSMAQAAADAAVLAAASTDATSKVAAEATRATGVEALKADLVGGVIPTAQLPALAINDTFPVASQAAMLALTAQRGDVAIRSDLGKSFILSVDAPTVFANWLELSAAGKVTSVNGQQGVVVLAKSDVGLGSVDNTADASKPVSTAQASADAAIGTAAASDATAKANAAQAAAVQRANHTGVQAITTVTGVQDLSDTTLKGNLDAVYPLRTQTFAVVVHNADATVARPAAPAVYWIGTVKPNNLQDPDFWYNPTGTADGPFEPLNGDYAHLLTAGESTFSRRFALSGNASASQGLRLTYFTAIKTETITSLRFVTGGTGAGATPTLCRLCVFEEQSDGSLTLVASTANDTTLFAAANTIYSKTLSSSWSKVRGKRYAIGRLIVTAATTPTFRGVADAGGMVNEWNTAPKLSTQWTGQSDLPATIPVANQSASSQMDYIAVAP